MVEAQRNFAYQQWVLQNVIPFVMPNISPPEFSPPQPFEDIPKLAASTNSSDDSSTTN